MRVLIAETEAILAGFGFVPGSRHPFAAAFLFPL